MNFRGRHTHNLASSIGLAGRYTTDFGLVAAGGLVAAIPPLSIALIFKRYIFSGMSAGSIKG